MKAEYMLHLPGDDLDDAFDNSQQPSPSRLWGGDVADDGTIFVADFDLKAIWKMKLGEDPVIFCKVDRNPIYAVLANSGDLYVTTSAPESVLCISKDGKWKVVAGGSWSGDLRDTRPASSAGFGLPRQLTVNHDASSTYVCDVHIHVIWQVIFHSFQN